MTTDTVDLNDALSGPPPSQAWKFPGRYGSLTSPPVMAGDRLIGVASRNVFAIDIHTGDLATTGDVNLPEWKIELQSRISSNPYVTTFGGVVYLMDGRDLLAFSLANAKRLPNWEVPKKLGRVSRLLAREDRVVAVHAEGKGTAVSGFEGRTGNKLFGPMPVAEHSAGSVTFGDGALFFVASGSLNAVNVDFGDVRWRYAGGTDKLDSAVEPVVAGDVALVAGAAIHGLDLGRGEKKFTVEASTPGVSGFHWFTPVADIPNAQAAATKAVNFRAVRPLLGDAYGTQAMLSLGAKARSGTAIATNTAGDVICFSLSDGRIVWQDKLNAPGAPVLIDGVVYITTDGGAQLSRFDAGSGKRAGVPFDLPHLMRNLSAVIGNGALFLPQDDGSVSAHPFTVQQVAYFDGVSSMVSVPAEPTSQPERGRFDFGTGDFTVEAWFRSSTGGEIVSSHPTSNDPDAHGFCMNLSQEGQLRVALYSQDGLRAIPGRTNHTFAADGLWHHAAFVRRDGDFMIVLDGLSHEVRFHDNLQKTALAIGGHAALTIGAFVAKAGARPTNLFRGLICEVRLWDRALDIRTIATNRATALTGLEPRLQGLWRLDEQQQPGSVTAPRNAASKTRIKADFVNAASRRTDFELDYRNFPYLLHESAAQWPYAGTWGARGEQPVSGSAAISADGVVAFTAGNAMYAVRAQDGTRVWAMNVNHGTSEPVADGSSFLVMTPDESLVRIDARSGGKVQVESFAGIGTADGSGSVRPAVNEDWIATCPNGDSSNVYLGQRASTNCHAVAVAGGVVEQLAFGTAGLAVMTKSGAQHMLNLIDPSDRSSRGSRKVNGAAFCMAGRSVFALGEGGVVKLNGVNLAGAPEATSAAIPEEITGLAVSVPHNLVVATTANRKVYGMTLGTLASAWTSELPAGPTTRSNRVNPPVIDADGRAVCTMLSGTIAVLGSESGALQGFYALPHGAVETPALRAGTIYTGCLPSVSFSNDVDDEIDGALHSIVLGETAVMRLNLDERGNPVPNGNQYALVEPDRETSTLHLLQLRTSCIEAWINAPMLSGAAAEQAGGGILGVAPTSDSGYEVNLWLDKAGTVHCTSRTRSGEGWQSLEVTAAAGLIDGRWHHIAISRLPDGRVLMYIDGQPVDCTITTGQDAPASVSETGLKAYIGACVATDLSASRPFRGMIAEVRVWDAWLPASEIVSRMHVKLRGDEPDLVAYWNFDYESVYDCARQGHDGDLAEDIVAPTWWLTDLPFTQPAYPYISTSAAIASEKDGKASSYEVTLKVCAANGQGISGEPVSLWYVRKQDSDPDSILINSTEVEAVTAGYERRRMLRAAHKQKAFAGTTGADGTLRVRVTSSVPDHGPAIDMWTAFMPEHLRFHVNVLIDNQTLAKPAPPVLTAQAKLIQDYHYSTGSRIDHSRDRSTWRVVVRAQEPTGGVRPREPITLWASQSLTIEIGSKSYAINQDNSVTVDAEFNGELTLVMPAEELTAPTLYARAGFMHRNDRVVINPDQDAHARLSTFDSKDLTEKRSTNWKRKEDRKASDEETLVSPDYAPHADEIAGAVRQVASSVKTDNPEAPKRRRGLTPARRQLVMIRPMEHAERKRLLFTAENAVWAPPVLLAMRQPAIVAPNDRVVPRRTLAGVSRPAPVDPEAFRNSMGGSLGFVFSATGKQGGFTYRELHTQEEVDAERGVASPRLVKARVAGFFDDLWDGIKDTANTIYDGAKSIVVTIADKIQVAITKMVEGIESVVHSVVESVKDALNAVAGFFEQLAAGIMKVIAFLRALFDWGNIIKTHDILFDIIVSSLTISANSFRNTAPFLNALRSISGVESSDLTGQASLNQAANDAGGQDSEVISNAKSVEGKSMVDRATTSPTRAAGDGKNPPVPSGGSSSPFDVIAAELPALAGSILDLAPGDLVQKLLDLLKRAAIGTFMTTGEMLAGLMAELVSPVEWVKKILETKIEIPFISELYKWITGRDLSILSVLCLALAVQVNVVYAVVTLIAGNPRFFFEDARTIADTMKKAAGLMQGGNPLAVESVDPKPVPTLKGQPPATPMAPEIALMVARVGTGLMDYGADYQFKETVGTGRPPTPAEVKVTGFVNLFQGVFGAVALSLQTFCSQVAFEDRVKAVATDDASRFLPKYKWATYTVYGLLIGLRGYKIWSGATAILKFSLEPGFLSRIKREYEFEATKALGFVSVGLVSYQICQLIDLLPELKKYGNDDVTEQYRLFAIRDILSCVPPMFEWAYTEDGAAIMRRRPGSEIDYIAFNGLRFFPNLAATALHGVAVFNYGGM
jgi:outer membrane protein assembly factor BamB